MGKTCYQKKFPVLFKSINFTALALRREVSLHFMAK